MNPKLSVHSEFFMHSESFTHSETLINSKSLTHSETSLTLDVPSRLDEDLSQYESAVFNSS